DVAAFSAGLARRVMLARALAAAPDLLLLDEPTNHLDVPSIEWLEAHLEKRAGATLFVTHDRAFLRRLATRILELDRGRLTSRPDGLRAPGDRRGRALGPPRPRGAGPRRGARGDAGRVGPRPRRPARRPAGARRPERQREDHARAHPRRRPPAARGHAAAGDE